MRVRSQASLLDTLEKASLHSEYEPKISVESKEFCNNPSSFRSFQPYFSDIILLDFPARSLLSGYIGFLDAAWFPKYTLAF